MLNVRIVGEERTQILLHVKEVEVSNTCVTATHKDDSINVAEIVSPSTIFIMVGKTTVDKIMK